MIEIYDSGDRVHGFYEEGSRVGKEMRIDLHGKIKYKDWNSIKSIILLHH